MSQYRGPIARAMGDRLRAERKKKADAARKRKLAAWRKTAAGKAALAREAKRLERQKTCAVCSKPNPPGAVGLWYCCSLECAEIKAARQP